MVRSLLVTLGFGLLISFPLQSLAQNSDKVNAEDLQRLINLSSGFEFQLELEEYVQKLFVDYGLDKISQEYYLIQMMQLVNKEYSRRLENPNQARENYFGELKSMLDEIQALKQRLRNAGIVELKKFISDLEARIKYTINASEINFKKKKVFEDALQMLYVAEEMIKLDQLRQPDQTIKFNQKMTESKKDLLTAFGEVSTGTLGAPGAGFTIYDLFSEWKQLDQKKYNLRLTDVKLARQNLIKSTDLEGISQMLNDELAKAYEYFNDNRYDLAERLLTDIVETYPRWGVKNLDDVQFYRAECNFALKQLLHAQNIFEDMLQTYPSTTYLKQVYSRLVQIYYTFENYSQAVKYANLYQNLSTTVDVGYYDVRFLSAMASYHLGEYGKAITLLSQIPQDQPYYYISSYCMGNAYAASQKYDDAIASYLQLVDNKNTNLSLVYQALYKIGIIEYERGNYFATIQYLSQIPQTYAAYDKVLNALAWAHYESEQSKPDDEPRNFWLAKQYANRLLNEFFASPYQMEAKSLLAYISQLEKRPANALSLYRNVYNTKLTKQEIDEYIDERESIYKLHQQAKQLKAEAFRKGDRQQYAKAVDLIDKLETDILRMELAEASGIGLGTLEQMNEMIDQLKELTRLRQIADSRNNASAVQKIDSIQTNLLMALDRFPIELIKDVQTINLFDRYPVSKLIAEDENRTEEYSEDRLELHDELNAIEASLSESENSIQKAIAVNDYSKVAELEYQKDRLRELAKNNDYLLSTTHIVQPESNAYPEFNKWGDFGAFGIINVQFYRKQQMQNSLSDIAYTLNHVNSTLESRKEVIEDKIKRIEAEIRFMTMKARVEERARLRAERERTFREGYFDTRTSETEEE